eukprot:TRINITY_DN10197_c0_g1_i1.p1 TRINITY_DN10197_c0_g1~~TRINITY_DN10197_c0_g1_i1.p1  ORF type:complete len:84 (+),score=6.16 TRINITY_DN10197_c0_g1_i1:16-267(+)
MGANIVHCGAAGTGQTANVCNNLILAISMIGVAEGMDLGVRLGIDPHKLAAIVNTSSGQVHASTIFVNDGFFIFCAKVLVSDF